MLRVEDVEGAFELGEGEVVAPVPKDGRVAHVDDILDGLWMRIDGNDRKMMMVVEKNEVDNDEK